MSSKSDLNKYLPWIVLVVLLVPVVAIAARGPGGRLVNPLERYTAHALSDDIYEKWLSSNHTVPSLINVTLWHPAMSGIYHLFKCLRGNWTGYRWQLVGAYLINQTVQVVPGLYKAITNASFAGLAAYSPGIFINLKNGRFFLHSDRQRLSLEGLL